MNLISCAWIWVYIGVALICLELIVPGFVLCFFGLGAISVGVLRAVLGEGFPLTVQLAAFSVLSIAYIVILRRIFKKAFLGERSDASNALTGASVGRLGRITEAVSPTIPGRVLVGDAEWTAESDAPIAVGTDVRVVSQHNLTMKVEVI